MSVHANNDVEETNIVEIHVLKDWTTRTYYKEDYSAPRGCSEN